MTRFLGFLLLLVAAFCADAAPRIVILEGADQKAVIGQRYLRAIKVRVFDENGDPAPYTRVLFHAPASGAPTVVFDQFQAMPYRVVGMTEQNGFVTSPGFTAGWGLGSGLFTITVEDGLGNALATATTTFTNTTADGAVTARVQDMWWAGRSENGWGMSVVQHGDRLFSVIFAYDLEGNPTWYAMPGGEWDQGFGSNYIGSLYQPSSTPFFAYDASRMAAGPPLGALRMVFNGPDTLYLEDGLGYAFFPHKAMVRQPFAQTIGARNLVSPLKGVGDMWWGGPSQNGWGVAIMEQPGNLFVVWYTYDENFRPIWFVMGGEWVDDTTFAGGIYQTRSSPWTGRQYDASQWSAITVGQHRLHFIDANRATIEYSLQGHTGTLSLTRQPF